MRLGLSSIFCVTLVLSAPLVGSSASAQGNSDPEAQANQSLGVKDPAATSPKTMTTPQPAKATSGGASTSQAKDLQADDVVVQEIRTQGSSSPNAKVKPVATPNDDEGDGTARDSESEAHGSAPVGKHEDTSPSEAKDGGADEATDNSETADQMSMKVRPEADAASDVDVTPVPTKQKPKRAQKTAASTKTLKKVEKKNAAAASAKKTVTSTAVTKQEKTADAAVSAETVLTWLTNGNTRFVKKRFRADGKAPADRARLEKGEHPHAAILAAADSRVVPEIIFDQALGEVYDVRAFGETLDAGTVAALEYAVAKLKVPLIVVMGNSDCAAIRTMLEDKVNENGDHVGDGLSSPDIEKVIADIKPRLKTLKDDPVSPGYEVEATLNADGIARELVKRSDIIREAVEKNGLVIKSALYRLGNGKVSFY